MSNETNVAERKEIEVVYEVEGNKIRLTPSIVQNYIVSGDANITMQEFKMFTELCKARKLNPFLKEAYCVKYSDKQAAQMLVGREVFLKRAILNQNYDGKETGIIVLTPNGEIVYREGTFHLETEALVGGWAKVYRKDWSRPSYCTVSFNECAQRKSDGSLNSNWYSKGATMIEKVAEVRALRGAFVEDLGGMYTDDEINVESKEPSVQKVVEQVEPEEEKSEIPNNKSDAVSLDDI